MSVESPLLLAAHSVGPEREEPPFDASYPWENWEPAEMEESVVEAGGVRVRFIPGGWVEKTLPAYTTTPDLLADEGPLSSSCTRLLESLVPSSLSKPRKALGFKHHVGTLFLSVVGVISTMILVGFLLGVVSFLLGVALPFDMLPEAVQSDS